MRWGGAFLFLGIVLWLGMSYAVARELTRRSRAPFAENLPDEIATQYESVRLTTSDGEQLGAWFRDGERDRPLFVLLHGNGGCRSSLLPQADWLSERGQGVLLVTLRAHGDSTGEHNDVGYSARHDVIAAVDWLRQRFPERPIVVWGQSIGGVAAVLAADENAADVDGYILECVYGDLKTAVGNRLRLMLPRGLDSIAYLGMWITSPLTAPHLSETSPIKAADKIPDEVPVLLVTGGADERAKVSEAEAIAERIGSNAEVVVIPDGNHLELLTADREGYFSAVERLLQRVQRRDQ